MPVWFGLHCPSYTFDDPAPERLFDQLLVQVRAAEDAGFGLVTVMDHLNQIPGIGPQDHPMLEAWSTLGALARETTRVRLGPLVTGVTYRNPALLAKTATTLDVLSGGRAVFGLGAAWFEAEHDSFGFAFPPIRERMDRLDEALTIARGMFAAERSTFAGAHYRTDDVLNVPRPGPGGGPAGPRRRGRGAADAADRGQARGHDPLVPDRAGRPRHKTDLLRGYCEDDRPRPGRDRADDGGAGRRRRDRGRGTLAVGAAAAGTPGDDHAQHARAGGRSTCVRTSTPGSRASRSTTTSTPGRSRSPPSGSCCGSSREPTRPFRFLADPGEVTDGPSLREAARRAESIGYHVLVYPDHVVIPFGFVPLLATVAAVTDRLRVAPFVANNDLRHPALLAQDLATLDVLSGGRVEVAIGAGWNRPEYAALGIPFDATGVRVSRLAEAVTVLKGCFADGPFSFAGEHYTITEHDGQPTPVQQPHPPLFIGGGGKRVLTLAGREADIVGLAPRTLAATDGGDVVRADPRSITIAATEEKIGWIREAAGDRFDGAGAQRLPDRQPAAAHRPSAQGGGRHPRRDPGPDRRRGRRRRVPRLAAGVHRLGRRARRQAHRAPGAARHLVVHGR